MLGVVSGFLVSQVWAFLTVPTQRYDAEVLVLEGWAVEFEFCLTMAAEEFASGRYQYLATSGIEDATLGPDGTRYSAANRAAVRLIELGVDPARIVPCPAPATRKNKTSSSARGVREQLKARGIVCTAINVVTTEPHSRQSRLAYRRMFEPDVRVGMIPVRNPNLNHNTWWRTTHGWRVAAKTFGGWGRELLLGLRD